MLRASGIAVPPSAVMTLAQALDLVGISDRRDVYWAARSILLSRHEQQPDFDRVFGGFWGGGLEPDRSARSESSRTESAPEPTGEPVTVDPVRAVQSWRGPAADGVANQEQSSPLTSYSPIELLGRKDFAALTAEELLQVEGWLLEAALDVGRRGSRRQTSDVPPPLDLSTTLRLSLRTGGEITELAGRRRKPRPRRLVVLADISGSMKPYSRPLLLFVVAMARRHPGRTEAFLFGTRLTRVTPHVRRHTLPETISQLMRSIPDWSGGTRIGQSLRTFNVRWAPRVLGRGAVVLLISDGWDRGEVGLLRTEMARLRSHCDRLIWLNPLLGSPTFEPLTVGLQAALPYVDDFMPAHSLYSLVQLGRALARLKLRVA